VGDHGGALGVDVRQCVGEPYQFLEVPCVGPPHLAGLPVCEVYGAGAGVVDYGVAAHSVRCLGLPGEELERRGRLPDALLGQARGYVDDVAFHLAAVVPQQLQGLAVVDFDAGLLQHRQRGVVDGVAVRLGEEGYPGQLPPLHELKGGLDGVHGVQAAGVGAYLLDPAFGDGGAAYDYLQPVS